MHQRLFSKDLDFSCTLPTRSFKKLRITPLHKQCETCADLPNFPYCQPTNPHNENPRNNNEERTNFEGTIIAYIVLKAVQVTIDFICCLSTKVVTSSKVVQQQLLQCCSISRGWPRQSGFPFSLSIRDRTPYYLTTTGTRAFSIQVPKSSFPELMRFFVNEIKSKLFDATNEL